MLLLALGIPAASDTALKHASARLNPAVDESIQQVDVHNATTIRQYLEVRPYTKEAAAPPRAARDLASRRHTARQFWQSRCAAQICSSTTSSIEVACYFASPFAPTPVSDLEAKLVEASQ